MSTARPEARAFATMAPRAAARAIHAGSAGYRVELHDVWLLGTYSTVEEARAAGLAEDPAHA